MASILSSLPPSFAANVRGVFGDRGDAWLTDLDSILAECAERWSISIGRPFEGVFVNFVAEATLANGVGAVLKAGVPDKERMLEAAALRMYDGDGVVRVIDSIDDGSCLLLERLTPGTPLRRIDRDEAARIAGGLMRRLWREPPNDHLFPTVADWMRGFDRMRARFDGGTGPMPARLVDTADGVFADLSQGAPQVLLHGDFHHDNVLAAEREPWIVIDPKGVVGDPGYDCGAFLMNAVRDVPPADVAPVLRRQLDIVSEVTGIDRERLRSWAIVQATLSTWWCIEDGAADLVDRAVAYAETLADLDTFSR